MASQSRACLAPDGGAGAPPTLRRRLGWLSGLISGAGRLISSVLDSPYSSSEEDDLLSEEGEDSDAQSKDLVDLNQSGKNLKQTMDNMDRSLAIVTKVHSKDAIEQLLVQETFSRDECDKLTKIIQSRVVDTVENGRYVAQKELLSRTNSNIISSPEARWSMDLLRELPERIPYCSPSLSPLSPGKWLLHGPDLHNTAVMEAKKWLDEKKSSSNSKCDLNCSPCNLNTDLSQYYVGGEVGTPVELAKSYMQSLLPWQSQFSSKSWKSEMYNAYQIYKDETSSPTTNHLFSSSKDLKRKFQASESRDTLDEIRRIRTKLMKNRSDCSYFHQLDFSARLLEASSPIGRSDTDVPGTYQIPVPVTEAAENRDVCDKLSTKISDEDHCLDDALLLNVEAAIDTNYPVSAASIDINLDGVETVNAVSPANGNLPVNLPVEPAEYYSGVGDEPMPCEPAVVLCEELGLKEPLQIDGQDIVCSPCDSNCLALTSNEHDGETVKCSQPITIPTEETKSVPSDADLQTSSAHISSGEGETVRVENSSLLHLRSNGKDSDPVIDTGSHKGNYQIHKAANDFVNENNVNCSSTGLVTVQVVGYAGHRRPTNSGNGELSTLGIPDGPFQATAKDVPLETNVGTGKSRNGMTMRSIKRMLTESKSTSRPKERKRTRQPRRSKAKVKGRSDQ